MLVIDNPEWIWMKKIALSYEMVEEAEQEIKELLNSNSSSTRTSHNGTERGPEKMRNHTFVGKRAECVLREKFPVDRLSDRTWQKYGRFHPKFDTLRHQMKAGPNGNIKYHDIIHTKTGEIYEVKCWAKGYATNLNSSGWLDIIAKRKRNTYFFSDYIVIFERDGENIRYAGCWRFEDLI